MTMTTDFFLEILQLKQIKQIKKLRFIQMDCLSSDKSTFCWAVVCLICFVESRKTEMTTSLSNHISTNLPNLGEKDKSPNLAS